MKKYLVILIIMFSYSTLLLCIEVSGHISTDTVWSPENNPYLVVDNIIIDENATLTIEPGTIVKFNTADKDGGDFYYDDGYTEAKFMLVRGKLAAVGTKQDSIIFTRNNYEVGQRWGSIIFMPESDSTSILKHCKFEYSYFIRLVLGGAYCQGAVSFLNSKVTITECLFNKYLFGISCYYYSSPLIYKNRFTSDPGDEDSECYRAIDLWHAYPIVFYNVFDNERIGIRFGYPYTDLQIPVVYNTFINSSYGIISDESHIYTRTVFTIAIYQLKQKMI